METINAIDYYDRTKNPRLLTLRPLTIEEAKNPPYHVKILDRNGMARDVRVNGKTKTWKTRPNDVTIPMKYRIREYFYSRMVNGEWVENVPYVVIED